MLSYVGAASLPSLRSMLIGAGSAHHVVCKIEWDDIIVYKVKYRSC